MNRDSFCNAVIEKLNVKYGESGWKARLLKDGYTSNDKKERELIKDTNKKYFNNLNDELVGDFIVLEHPNGSCIRQEVDYLLESFNDDGWDSIYDIFEKNRELFGMADISPKAFGNFEDVKDKIIVRPLNYLRNKAALEGKVYKAIGDFVLALYIKLFSSENDLMTTKVSEDLLDKWGISADEAIELGLKNASNYFPPRVYGMKYIFKKPGFDDGIYMGDEGKNFHLGELGEDAFTAYESANGAASFFYPGVKERIAEMTGGEDYYVVFTSIADFHIHKCSNSDCKTLKARLIEINGKFSEEELLTEKVFRYSVNQGKLNPVEE